MERRRAAGRHPAQTLNYLSALEAGVQRVEELPCAWIALFGTCSKAADGKCGNCKSGARERPVDLVERVKAVCVPALAAEIV